MTPQPTGLLLTVTPKYVASTLLVRCHLTIGANFWYTAPEISVARDGTKIWPSVATSMSHRLISGTLGNTRLLTYPATFEFMDSPATTAPVTYEVMLASSTSGNNVHLNVRDSDLAIRGESSLFVTEISG